MQSRESLRVTRNQTGHGQDTVVQIMHINQRIRIKTPDQESLSLFFQKLILYFEIEKNSNQLGLFERKGRGEYLFVQDKGELAQDHLYYLYFRDKPDRLMSPGNDEETKKSKSTNSPTPNSGSFSRRYNNSFSQFQGVSLTSAQIEKVKRPKEEKKVLICPFEKCLKEFSETGNLKTHMRTHTGERPFICKQCGLQFITKGHLQAHELTHTGEKPFICNHQGCNKRYSRAGRLKIHQRLHTGERPFICQVEGCEKAFREKGNLLTHMRIHNGQKPFRCDFADCDMSFTTQGHLTDHKRRHSGERPYICEICKDKFMRSSTLKIHMRRHTGEKPYKCDKCDRAFSESGNLRTHLRTHVIIPDDEGSIIGKRSRKNNSRYSSPQSTISNKRTLKATRKMVDQVKKESLGPYSPDSFNTMPQVQLEFQASNNQKRRKESAQYNNQQPQISQRPSISINQVKDDDIKLPLPKQEQAIVNDPYYFLNQNEPITNSNHTPNYQANIFAETTTHFQQTTVIPGKSNQQPMSNTHFMPFSPSSLLNYHNPSFSPKGPNFQQQGLQFLNTPTGDQNNHHQMRMNTRKAGVQNQQQQQLNEQIRKMGGQQNLSSNYMPQQNPKFSPMSQLFSLESPDINTQAQLIGFQKTEMQQIHRMTVNDLSPNQFYRKQECPQVLIGATHLPQQLINGSQHHISFLNTTVTSNNPLGNSSILNQMQGMPQNQEDEMQSFSHLAKIWQGKANNSSNSPCVSQEASPLLRKPISTPRGQGVGEWHSSFSTLANAANAIKQNQAINISENSAFKRGSPRAAGNKLQGNTMIPGFSGNNTPKMYNQDVNKQMMYQNRKSSSFSSCFQQPSSQSNQMSHIQQQQQQQNPQQQSNNRNQTQGQQVNGFRISPSPSIFDDIQSPMLIQKQK